MEEVTARVYLVSISRSRYSAVYVGGHAKTALLHAAISAAAHQMCEMLMNVQFRLCRDERSELLLEKKDSKFRTVDLGGTELGTLQLRSLVAADAKIHIHQHPTCLMRCRADGRVKENRFRMTPIING